MTREEAIEVIKQDIPCEYDTDLIEALDMAIKALGQEPSGDAISRQAVLEMAYDMSEIDGEHFIEPCMVVDVEDIEEMPSVTPTQNCVENALDMCCDDAISRQAVIDILEKEGHKWGNDYRDWVDAIEEIKKLPHVNPASNISIQITEREKYGRFN